MSYVILPPPSAEEERVKLDLKAIRKRGVYVSPIVKTLEAADAAGFYGYAVEAIEEGEGKGVLLYIPDVGNLYAKLKGGK